MARLDLFLKNSGLCRQRRAARRACDAGQVWVAGQPAKASREIRVGELVRLCASGTELEVEILAIPDHPVSKNERDRYCRIIRVQHRTAEAQAFGFDEELSF